MSNAPLPPGSILYQLSVGHYVSRALHLAAKLGVADLLAAGPRSAGELAAKTGTDAAALRRVLRLLVSVGVFTEADDGAFATTPLGDAMRSDVPGSESPMRSRRVRSARTTSRARSTRTPPRCAACCASSRAWASSRSGPTAASRCFRPATCSARMLPARCAPR